MTTLGMVVGGSATLLSESDVAIDGEVRTEVNCAGEPNCRGRGSTARRALFVRERPAHHKAFGLNGERHGRSFR
jgi:hypothetical protein